MESSNVHATNWAQECDDAEREPDPTKLLQLLSDIENRIFMRLQEIGAEDSEERPAIDKAIAKVRQLQVEKLNFPRLEMEIRPLEERESSGPSQAIL